jgi:hypothetical protein
MRDTITHYSSLTGFKCFVEEPHTGNDTIRIHYPSMPSDQRVDHYCRHIFEELLSLYQSCLSFIST